MVVAYGTQDCVDKTNKKDLTDKVAIGSVFTFVDLLTTIEVWDKYQGSGGNHASIVSITEILNQLSTTVSCPHESIRFFHRHNSCDCLHKI